MHYTYVLSRKDGKYYTGYSGDLRKRFSQHKGRYYEACVEEEDARAREKFHKSGPGKSYLTKRLKRFLQLTGYGPVTGSP
jgi:putative endonuclease